MKSTIRDGWGILLNAASYITDQDAIHLLRVVRIANIESFSKEWVRGNYPIVKKEG